MLYYDFKQFVMTNISGIRLVGGSRCSGRLEVPHGNTWYTVCDTVFDQQDAEVVCRELDCGAPVQVLGAAAFGKGNAQMWTQEIQCRGDEYQFALCPTTPSQFCSHENDVSVVCAETVRLVGGNSRCAGRVEVLHDGEWGTVCDVGWDLPDAAVVCRELGCGEALTAPKSAYFGEGSGEVWISGLQCTGSEFTLTNCRFNGWGIEANHTEDAGVICSGVRLVGGSRCSGRVEVPHDQTWMSVCDAVFDQQDAEVVCRELDCGAPVRVLGAAAFGKGDAQMWTQEIQCGGNESYISLCPTSSSLKQNCTHENATGLLCFGYTDLRLVNGPDICSGRVERQYFSKWGTVCDACWDMRAASGPLSVSVHYSCHNIISFSSSFSSSALNISRSSTNSSTSVSPSAGSLISEELHSGYEDADELLSEEMVKEITPGYYDDVITDGLKPNLNTPENYDDVIINRPSSRGVTEGVQEEYDDVMSVSEDVRNLLDQVFPI
ncbi:deleted in malignant brain tumors 1 protein-like [Cyprinus carpio]|uniref:Deleted in malignant brain tumors 1 protein-like n=1 Tax=Cyprinus carpio TaxID=7962 RepID=A0A9Q9WYZ3_CYPCA|nr:deleted in malignant brain tumors 1 protein-like [Cyprinus carpio]